MVSARVTSVKVMPYLRPLTQNRLMTPRQLSALVKEYIRTNDINRIYRALDELSVEEEFVPLKEHIKVQIKNIE